MLVKRNVLEGVNEMTQMYSYNADTKKGDRRLLCFWRTDDEDADEDGTARVGERAEGGEIDADVEAVDAKDHQPAQVRHLPRHPRRRREGPECAILRIGMQTHRNVQECSAGHRLVAEPDVRQVAPRLADRLVELQR